ncbi:hypothetical protein HI914_07564 [Erysiphe necator]|nr:hypothetical protein HI914_07564 [Erysiphe necator]
MLPMPSEHDDDDHEKTAIPTTTKHRQTAATIAIPTDHPERPQKPPKASGTKNEGAAATATATATASTSAVPTSSTDPTAVPAESEVTWLPSFFPKFGASARSLAWIYGAIGLILAFCGGLAVYLYRARLQRLRNNPRDEWEFDLLEDEEREGLNSGRTRNMGKVGSKRRAGELYDAFAAASEDESDDYFDSDEGGDEREKRLYEDEDEGGRHVIGDDYDEDDYEEDYEDDRESNRMLEKTKVW